MAATAVARRVAATAPRRATANRPALKPRPRPARPARRPHSGRPRASAAGRKRSQSTPIAGFVPVAVGATAGAIGGIADSGLVVRLTRGRLWIGALGTLLVGIVALNVFALSFNASSSRVAQQTDGLKRANSALQAQIAGQLSNEQVHAAAARLGLLVPAPGAIRYLSPAADDAAVAARRLADGDFTIGSTFAPALVAPAPAIATTPTEPVTSETAPVGETTAPAAAPVAPDPAAAPAPGAGAVTAP